MAAKAIYEAKGKSLLNKELEGVIEPNKYASVGPDTDWDKLLTENSWLQNTVSFAAEWFMLLLHVETKTCPSGRSVDTMIPTPKLADQAILLTL